LHIANVQKKSEIPARILIKNENNGVFLKKELFL